MEHFTSLCGVLIDFIGESNLPNSAELMGIYGRVSITELSFFHFIFIYFYFCLIVSSVSTCSTKFYFIYGCLIACMCSLYLMVNDLSVCCKSSWNHCISIFSFFCLCCIKFHCNHCSVSVIGLCYCDKLQKFYVWKTVC